MGAECLVLPFALAATVVGVSGTGTGTDLRLDVLSFDCGADRFLRTLVVAHVGEARCCFRLTGFRLSVFGHVAELELEPEPG